MDGIGKKEHSGSILMIGHHADPLPHPQLINPVAVPSHFDGIAVIGGYVYRGSLAPLLTGKYIFGDLLGPSGYGRLFSGNLVSGTLLEFHLGGQHNPLIGSFLKGIGRDDAGEIYILIDSNIGPSGTGRPGFEDRWSAIHALIAIIIAPASVAFPASYRRIQG